MSLQLVIPRRVALQQSSPPLHQPSVILKEKRKFEKEKPWNGNCANSKLSHRRGSPQPAVSKLCQNPPDWGPWRSVLSEKQTPQVIVFPRKLSEKVELLDRASVRPWQVRYQAAVHPASR